MLRVSQADPVCVWTLLDAGEDDEEDDEDDDRVPVFGDIVSGMFDSGRVSARSHKSIEW